MDLVSLEGLIHAEEGERLRSLASAVPSGLTIVEVGSYKGQSTAYLATGSREGNGVEVAAVDLWEEPGAVVSQRHRYQARETHLAFLRQIDLAGVSDLVNPYQGASAHVAGWWRNPVGLLFIDATHTYDGVKADLDAWLPHVVSGGVVALHDWCDRFPGVARAAEEFVAAGVLVGPFELTDRLWTAVKA